MFAKQYFKRIILAGAWRKEWSGKRLEIIKVEELTIKKS